MSQTHKQANNLLAHLNARVNGMVTIDAKLDLSGGVDFYGVIVVLGRLTTSGAGGRVHGAVLAAGGGGASRIGAGSAVAYSACAVQRALAGAAQPVAFSEHAWEQLY